MNFETLLTNLNLHQMDELNADSFETSSGTSLGTSLGTSSTTTIIIIEETIIES